MLATYLPNFKIIKRVLHMLPKGAQAAHNIQGTITFDPGIQLEKK